jgi:hypothetical protein
MSPDLPPITEQQPSGIGSAQIGTARLRVRIPVAHGGFGDDATLAARIHTPAQMPAHCRGRTPFLGGVPDLNELEVNGVIGAPGKVQRPLLREPL